MGKGQMTAAIATKNSGAALGFERSNPSGAMRVDVENRGETLRTRVSPEHTTRADRSRIVGRCEHCCVQRHLRQQLTQIRCAAYGRVRMQREADRGGTLRGCDVSARVEGDGAVLRHDANDVDLLAGESEEPAQTLQGRGCVLQVRRSQRDPNHRISHRPFGEQREIEPAADRSIRKRRR